MEGKWQVRVTGPSVTGQKGLKVLYCHPDPSSGLEAAAKFLRIRSSQFVAAGDAPRAAPQAAAPSTSSSALLSSTCLAANSVRLSVQGQPVRLVTAGPCGGSRGYSGALDASAANVSLAPPTGEQARVIDLVVRQRKSVFLTGSAGTGKSFVLKHIQKGLAGVLPPGTLHLTAPTGIAAINIGGSTIHSFAGIGLGVGPHDRIIAKCISAAKTVTRWREAQALIIDEVSMVSADMFELLSSVAKACRGNSQPFGGLQLVGPHSRLLLVSFRLCFPAHARLRPLGVRNCAQVLCGDFFQLGPVNPFRGIQGQVFAFETDAWAAAVEHVVCLRKVVRQQGDTALTSILEEIRWGGCSPETENVLAACARRLPSSNGVLATRLYCTNVRVDDENARELARLPGDTLTYTAAESGDKDALDALDKGCPAASTLELKVDAQVVLVWNLSQSLVNGSRGVVTCLSAATGNRGVSPSKRSHCCGAHCQAYSPVSALQPPFPHSQQRCLSAAW